MSKTKSKILAAALRLFNQHGLVNVRLQHIADKVGISVGNLAYHYYSKKAIVKAIDEELSEEIAPFIAQDRLFLSLMDFDNHLAKYYHLLSHHSFYFIDLLELKRAYPKLYKKRETYSYKIILQIENWFNFNEERGLIKKPIRPAHYKVIAHTIWMIITFWMTQPLDKGIPEERERIFKEVVWSQVLPYLTDCGRLEFDLMIERLLDSYNPETEVKK